MTLYSYVQSCIDSMDVGELITIPIPDKLKAFRKFLSEIAARDYKKFTTKVVNDELHIMRVNYYSVTKKLNADD